MTTPTATIFLPWHALDEVHQAGLAATRPAASAVVPGTLYFSTDSGVLERSDGTTWAAYSGAGGGSPSAPTVTEGQLLGRGSTSGDGPAEEIAPGEYIAMTGDQIDVAGAGATSFIVQSLAAARAAVAGLGKAPADYLPNAQEMALLPTGYVTNTTGTGVLGSTPTIPAAALPPTIAYTDRTNTFAQPQVLQHAAARLSLLDTDQPANSRRFRLISSFQSFRIHAVSDDDSVQQSELLVLNRSGDAFIIRDVYERGRPAAMGHWQNIPFSAANFSATGGMTWTVGSAAVIRNRYAVVGNILYWSFFVSWFSGSNVIGGTASTVLLLNHGLPYTFAPSQTVAVDVQGGIVGVPVLSGVQADTSGSSIRLSKPDGSNFVVGATPGFIANLTLEIQ